MGYWWLIRIQNRIISYTVPCLATESKQNQLCNLANFHKKNYLAAWTIKSLSFAGKFTRISSVIYRMVNFWSSVFALLKRFYEKIDSLCAAFLLKNSTTSASGAKASWASICKPKKEWDLVWEVWRIFKGFSTSKGSGTISQARANYRLLGCIQMCLLGSVYGPTVRNMLMLKDSIGDFLRCSIGDGK